MASTDAALKPSLERIYIGGLDPPELRPSDVQKRLASLDGIDIVSVDLNDSKAFYHVNARSLKENMSALAIVTKNYNNVKWKGCRLTVQGARPHILDRLKQERLDRQAVQKAVAEAATNEPKEESPKEPTTLPRRLRIRQKYGAEAHRVDTKPCETSDWSSFDKIVSQMRKRQQRERKSKGTKEDKTKSFYNRAVHMKFDDDGNASSVTTPPPLVDDKEVTKIKRGSGTQKNERANSDDEDESDSDDSDDDSVEEVKPNKSKNYEWSSDEEGDSDDEPDATGTKKSTVASTSNDADGPKTEAAKTMEAANKDGSKGYEWSSDEDGSDEEIKFRTVKAETEAVSEFASAIDFGNDIEEESDDDEEYFQGSTMEVGEAAHTHVEDLHKDVETNLDVLTKLFPDLKKATPRQVEADQVAKPKWDTGTMERYDPTKESAQKFEIQKEETEDSDSDSDSDSSSDDDDDDNEKKPETKKAVVEESIYHEAKLEQVFRNARDSGEAGGFQVAPKFGEQPDELKEKEKMKKVEDTAGSFSFNFELAAEPVVEEKKAEDENKFSFGFDVPDPPPATDKTEGVNEDDVAMADDYEPEDAGPASKRHRGFFPPEDVADRFYTKFFELNDGFAIQDDPVGFRTDENVKAEWKQERQTLTQDWKRKRKFAQSRLQKKYKFR